MRIASEHERKYCGLYEMVREMEAPGRRAKGARPTREMALAKNITRKLGNENSGVRRVKPR